MRLFFYIALLGTLSSRIAFGQTYTGPVAKPISGYGADGSYTVAKQVFENPSFRGHDIEIYYPAGISSPVPTLFYSHAFGGNDPNNISVFLNFVARKGYAVVFVPYQTLGGVELKYSNLLNGFAKAAHDYPTIIDTTKVGFVGHSFGGGASFANAYHFFTKRNWGQSGRFILSMAQWYSYNLSETDLKTFPNDVKLLTIVYEDDFTNDHRMANDIFNTINIPASEKDYLRVKSDTIDGYVYKADHVVPNNSAFNALDYYAYYRLLDALCDFVFNGNMDGKDVALGNGSSKQISMPGGLHNLIHSDFPMFANAQTAYQFPCNSPDNPRKESCNSILSVSKTSDKPQVAMFPNPARSLISLETDGEISLVEIFNQQGQLVKIATSTNVTIGELPNGLYLVKITLDDKRIGMEKLIKEK